RPVGGCWRAAEERAGNRCRAASRGGNERVTERAREVHDPGAAFFLNTERRGRRRGSCAAGGSMAPAAMEEARARGRRIGPSMDGGVARSSPAVLYAASVSCKRLDAMAPARA